MTSFEEETFCFWKYLFDIRKTIQRWNTCFNLKSFRAWNFVYVLDWDLLDGNKAIITWNDKFLYYLWDVKHKLPWE